MLHICRLFDKLNEKETAFIRSMLPIFGFPLNAGVGHVLELLPTMPRTVSQM